MSSGRAWSPEYDVGLDSRTRIAWSLAKNKVGADEIDEAS